MKRFPWILSGIHAVLAVGIYWWTIAQHRDEMLAPMWILYFLDFPCSIMLGILSAISPAFAHFLGEPSLIISGVLYVVLGSAWFYLIGVGFRAAARGGRKNSGNQ